ncbi:MAG: hypothetical protein HY600_04220, partial [Candidatus Omnitrophica bacterium]|nr:hypothetical protein [Candidatus Omnitrophota bacterium]
APARVLATVTLPPGTHLQTRQEGPTVVVTAEPVTPVTPRAPARVLATVTLPPGRQLELRRHGDTLVVVAVAPKPILPLRDPETSMAHRDDRQAMVRGDDRRSFLDLIGASDARHHDFDLTRAERPLDRARETAAEKPPAESVERPVGSPARAADRTPVLTRSLERDDRAEPVSELARAREPAPDRFEASDRPERSDRETSSLTAMAPAPAQPLSSPPEDDSFGLMTLATLPQPLPQAPRRSQREEVTTPDDLGMTPEQYRSLLEASNDFRVLKVAEAAGLQLEEFVTDVTKLRGLSLQIGRDGSLQVIGTLTTLEALKGELRQAVQGVLGKDGFNVEVKNGVRVTFDPATRQITFSFTVSLEGAANVGHLGQGLIKAIEHLPTAKAGLKVQQEGIKALAGALQGFIKAEAISGPKGQKVQQAFAALNALFTELAQGKQALTPKTLAALKDRFQQVVAALVEAKVFGASVRVHTTFTKDGELAGIRVEGETAVQYLQEGLRRIAKAAGKKDGDTVEFTLSLKAEPDAKGQIVVSARMTMALDVTPDRAVAVLKAIHAFNAAAYQGLLAHAGVLIKDITALDEPTQISDETAKKFFGPQGFRLEVGVTGDGKGVVAGTIFRVGPKQLTTQGHDLLAEWLKQKAGVSDPDAVVRLVEIQVASDDASATRLKASILKNLEKLEDTRLSGALARAKQALTVKLADLQVRLEFTKDGRRAFLVVAATAGQYTADVQARLPNGWVADDPVELWIDVETGLSHLVTSPLTHREEVTPLVLAGGPAAPAPREAPALDDRFLRPVRGEPMTDKVKGLDRLQQVLGRLASDPVMQQLAAKAGLRGATFFLRTDPDTGVITVEVQRHWGLILLGTAAVREPLLIVDPDAPTITYALLGDRLADPVRLFTTAGHAVTTPAAVWLQGYERLRVQAVRDGRARSLLDDAPAVFVYTPGLGLQVARQTTRGPVAGLLERGVLFGQNIDSGAVYVQAPTIDKAGRLAAPTERQIRAVVLDPQTRTPSRVAIGETVAAMIERARVVVPKPSALGQFELSKEPVPFLRRNATTRLTPTGVVFEGGQRTFAAYDRGVLVPGVRAVTGAIDRVGEDGRLERVTFSVPATVKPGDVTFQVSIVVEVGDGADKTYKTIEVTVKPYGAGDHAGMLVMFPRTLSGRVTVRGRDDTVWLADTGQMVEGHEVYVFDARLADGSSLWDWAASRFVAPGDTGDRYYLVVPNLVHRDSGLPVALPARPGTYGVFDGSQIGPSMDQLDGLKEAGLQIGPFLYQVDRVEVPGRGAAMVYLRLSPPSQGATPFYWNAEQRRWHAVSAERVEVNGQRHFVLETGERNQYVVQMTPTRQGYAVARPLPSVERVVLISTATGGIGPGLRTGRGMADLAGRDLEGRVVLFRSADFAIGSMQITGAIVIGERGQQLETVTKGPTGALSLRARVDLSVPAGAVYYFLDPATQTVQPYRAQRLWRHDGFQYTVPLGIWEAGVQAGAVDHRAAAALAPLEQVAVFSVARPGLMMDVTYRLADGRLAEAVGTDRQGRPALFFGLTTGTHAVDTIGPVGLHLDRLVKTPAGIVEFHPTIRPLGDLDVEVVARWNAATQRLEEIPVYYTRINEQPFMILYTGIPRHDVWTADPVTGQVAPAKDSTVALLLSAGTGDLVGQTVVIGRQAPDLTARDMAGRLVALPRGAAAPGQDRDVGAFDFMDELGLRLDRLTGLPSGAMRLTSSALSVDPATISLPMVEELWWGLAVIGRAPRYDPTSREWRETPTALTAYKGQLVYLVDAQTEPPQNALVARPNATGVFEAVPPIGAVEPVAVFSAHNGMPLGLTYRADGRLTHLALRDHDGHLVLFRRDDFRTIGPPVLVTHLRVMSSTGLQVGEIALSHDRLEPRARHVMASDLRTADLFVWNGEAGQFMPQPAPHMAMNQPQSHFGLDYGTTPVVVDADGQVARQSAHVVVDETGREAMAVHTTDDRWVRLDGAVLHVRTGLPAVLPIGRYEEPALAAFRTHLADGFDIPMTALVIKRDRTDTFSTPANLERAGLRSVETPFQWLDPLAEWLFTGIDEADAEWREAHLDGVAPWQAFLLPGQRLVARLDQAGHATSLAATDAVLLGHDGQVHLGEVAELDGRWARLAPVGELLDGRPAVLPAQEEGTRGYDTGGSYLLPSGLRLANGLWTADARALITRDGDVAFVDATGDETPPFLWKRDERLTLTVGTFVNSFGRDLGVFHDPVSWEFKVHLGDGYRRTAVPVPVGPLVIAEGPNAAGTEAVTVRAMQLQTDVNGDVSLGYPTADVLDDEGNRERGPLFPAQGSVVWLRPGTHRWIETRPGPSIIKQVALNPLAGRGPALPDTIYREQYTLKVAYDASIFWPTDRPFGPADDEDAFRIRGPALRRSTEAIQVPQVGEGRWLVPGERFFLPVENGPNGKPQWLEVSLNALDSPQPNRLTSYGLWVTGDDAVVYRSPGQRISLTVNGARQEYEVRGMYYDELALVQMPRERKAVFKQDRPVLWPVAAGAVSPVAPVAVGPLRPQVPAPATIQPAASPATNPPTRTTPAAQQPMPPPPRRAQVGPGSVADPRSGVMLGSAFLPGWLFVRAAVAAWRFVGTLIDRGREFKTEHPLPESPEPVPLSHHSPVLADRTEAPAPFAPSPLPPVGLVVDQPVLADRTVAPAPFAPPTLSPVGLTVAQPPLADRTEAPAPFTPSTLPPVGLVVDQPSLADRTVAPAPFAPPPLPPAGLTVDQPPLADQT